MNVVLANRGSLKPKETSFLGPAIIFFGIIAFYIFFFFFFSFKGEGFKHFTGDERITDLKIDFFSEKMYSPLK